MWRVVVEPTQGIPYARNRALCEARGEWLAFLDDDCEVTTGWLSELTECANVSLAQAVAGGWEIAPEGNPSSWVPSGVWGPKAYVLDGVEARAGDELPVAYTRNVLFQIDKDPRGRPTHLFDPGLAGSGGSDALFFHEFVQAGNKIVFWPEAHSKEYYGDERLTLAWHLRRRIRNTQSRLRRAPKTGEKRFNLHGGAGQLLADLLRLPILLVSLAFFPRNPSLRKAIGRSLLKAAVVLGVMLYYLRLHYFEYSSSWKWVARQKATA